MQTIIISCLCLIIVLLLSEKFEIRRKTSTKSNLARSSKILPEIIGRPKDNYVKQVEPPERIVQTLPTFNPEDLDIEPDENEYTNRPNLDSEVNQNTPVTDLAEEEEELAEYADADEAGFARGVTFDELSKAATLSQSNNLSAEDKQTIVHVIDKVRDTELFTLLEQSIGNYSRDIALYFEEKSGEKSLENSEQPNNKDVENFDIEGFL